MSIYPDSPKPKVKALRDRLYGLFEARKFDEAADLALTLPVTVTRYSPIDTIADRIARRRAGDALRLYEMALEGAVWVASGASSGAEGSAFMLDVRRIEKKLASARDRAGKAPGTKPSRQAKRRVPR